LADRTGRRFPGFKTIAGDPEHRNETSQPGKPTGINKESAVDEENTEPSGVGPGIYIESKAGANGYAAFAQSQCENPIEGKNFAPLAGPLGC